MGFLCSSLVLLPVPWFLVYPSLPCSFAFLLIVVYSFQESKFSIALHIFHYIQYVCLQSIYIACHLHMCLFTHNKWLHCIIGVASMFRQCLILLVIPNSRMLAFGIQAHANSPFPLLHPSYMLSSSSHCRPRDHECKKIAQL